MKYSIIPFFIPHVGCPHICVFCNQRRITGIQNLPTPEEIKETINAYTAISAMKSSVVDRDTIVDITKPINKIHQNKIDDEEKRNWEVAFYGGSFSAIPRELQESLLKPAYEALQAGKIQAIRCSTRPDAVSEEVLDFLYNYGVRTIELGVQSMDDSILVKAKRGHTAQDAQEAAKRIKAKGMSLGIQLMPGLPGETWQTLVHTAVAATKLNADIARIYPVLVIADTELAEQYEAGVYKPLTVSKAVAYSAFLKTWLEDHGIKVIRTGLQSTEDFDAGKGLLAGPYEPSLGEQVVARQLRNDLEQVLWQYCLLDSKLKDSILQSVRSQTHREDKPYYKKLAQVKITYPRSHTSKVRGVKRMNMKYFKAKYPFIQWKWEEQNTQSYIKISIETTPYILSI